MHSAYRTFLGLACVAALGSGCFKGNFADGYPCTNNDDCGRGVSCENGFCGGRPPGTSSATTTTSAETSVGPTSSDTTTTSTESSESSTGANCVDEPPLDQCVGLDILFVMDNTSSFGDWAVPLFMKILPIIPDLTQWADTICDYHIGILTNTPQVLNPAGCQGLGALSQVDAGASSCDFVNGSYITREDPNLDQSLLCGLGSGINGDDGDERGIEATITALTGDGPSGCNAGFLRDDTPLMLVIITDTDDTNSLMSIGTVQEWVDQFAAIKGGDADNVGVVALVGTDVDICTDPTAETATNLINFTTGFTASKVINLCADDLVEFVEGVATNVGPQACGAAPLGQQVGCCDGLMP